MKVILASQSPRRRELLGLIKKEFLVVPADINEEVLAGENPETYVKRMAAEKAQVIAQQYPEDLIIGSDTIVVNEDRILGKPTSRQEAKEMLLGMSGRTHEVYTAVHICSATHSETFICSASVTFYELTEEEIESYLAREEYADKAGAYGIQGGAAVFVKDVKGDYYSIVGFPVGAVNQAMKKFTTI